MGVSASDTHSRKNTGMSTAEAADRIIAMAPAGAGGGRHRAGVGAVGLRLRLRGGRSPRRASSSSSAAFTRRGLLQISLADTAGHATPDQVERLFTAVQAIDPAIECACHLHNTYGMGLANACAALRVGVKYFESAFGGLGGCPFTRIAGGNVCTEDFVHMLQRMGHRHDVKLDALVDLARGVGAFLGRDMTGAPGEDGAHPGVCADTCSVTV